MHLIVSNAMKIIIYKTMYVRKDQDFLIIVRSIIWIKMIVRYMIFNISTYMKLMI